ncbi:MAG: YigZ family protein [bacterium]|nr:YigZ family protein [bacterium]
MYSIKSDVEDTTIIKKSKFITKLYYIDNINQITDILIKIKTIYSDASHICYAYIINSVEKCSDDKEPSGTAGIPILNVLKKNNLTNILAIVIRYFGGIKLGSSNLARTYSNCITNVLKNTNIIKIDYGLLIKIEFDFSKIKSIDFLLKNKNILNKIFNNTITYEFYIKYDELKLIDELKKLCIKTYIGEKKLIKIGDC